MAREIYSRDDNVYFVSGRGFVVCWKEIEGIDLFAFERRATDEEIGRALRTGRLVNTSTQVLVKQANRSETPQVDQSRVRLLNYGWGLPVKIKVGADGKFFFSFQNEHYAGENLNEAIDAALYTISRVRKGRVFV